jgi:hypothetical protein
MRRKQCNSKKEERRSDERMYVLGAAVTGVYTKRGVDFKSRKRCGEGKLYMSEICQALCVLIDVRKKRAGTESDNQELMRRDEGQASSPKEKRGSLNNERSGTTGSQMGRPSSRGLGGGEMDNLEELSPAFLKPRELGRFQVQTR